MPAVFVLSTLSTSKGYSRNGALGIASRTFDISEKTGRSGVVMIDPRIHANWRQPWAAVNFKLNCQKFSWLSSVIMQMARCFQLRACISHLYHSRTELTSDCVRIFFHQRPNPTMVRNPTTRNKPCGWLIDFVSDLKNALKSINQSQVLLQVVGFLSMVGFGLFRGTQLASLSESL